MLFLTAFEIVDRTSIEYYDGTGLFEKYLYDFSINCVALSLLLLNFNGRNIFEAPSHFGAVSNTLTTFTFRALLTVK